MDNKRIEELRELILNNEDYNKLVEKYGVDNIMESLTTFSEIMVQIADIVKEVTDVFIEVIKSEEFKDAIRESDLFQEALDMCDVDVRWRYEYLFDLLCNLEDESMELYEELEKANVDYEIADRLIEEYDFDAGSDLIYANKRVTDLTKEIEEVEYRIDVVTDLYDECFFNILANLE